MCMLSLIIISLLSRRCMEATPPRCLSALRTTKYFPPSSRIEDLTDLGEILENVLFTDARCRTALSFAACYLAYVPCSNSLPEPFCMENCILIDAMREHFCPTEFQLILKLNNSLSQDLGSINCRQPFSYLNTTNFSSNCFELQKLGMCVCKVIHSYKNMHQDVLLIKLAIVY